MAKRKQTKTFLAEIGVGARAKKAWPMSLKIRRWGGEEHEDLPFLENLLLDAQLDMTATITADGDCEGQMTMAHAEKVRPLECVVTCSSGVRFSTTHASFRLSLPLDVKPAHLDKFQFANAKVKLTRIGDLPAGDAEEESAEEEAGDE